MTKQKTTELPIEFHKTTDKSFADFQRTTDKSPSIYTREEAKV